MKVINQLSKEVLENSSLLFGESVFTSILCLNGTLLFLDDHLERLCKGIQFLFSNQSHSTLKTEIKDELLSFCNQIQQISYSIRITCTREGYFITHREWQETHASLNIGISENMRSNSIRPSYLKLSQYALERRELSKFPEFDDLLILDEQQNLAETSSSNIFLIMGDRKILTPPLSSKILDGVIRSNLIFFLNENNFEVSQDEIHIEQLKDAQEIWLTNSLKGLRIVSHFKNLNYTESTVYKKVVSSFGRYGEKYYE